MPRPSRPSEMMQASASEGARLQPCHQLPVKKAASAAGVRSAKLHTPKRFLQLCVLVLAAFTMLGAGSPSNRFDKLGHSLMCTCGCGEILLECNHVGCPVSGPMIQELKAQLATPQPDKTVLNWFASKYGPIALAAPIRGGFDLVAWIVPFAVLFIAIVAVIWLLRHWRDRHTLTAATAGAPAPFSPSDDMRERIRRETSYEP